jgi:dTDP-glucose 4,6-dehydratase/UDP-glucuronate decarboxylase
MRQLANLILRVSKSKRRVVHRPSQDSNYLTDNPQRRCPDISKARSFLGFEPKVSLELGLSRMLNWYREFAELETLLEGADGL